MIRAKAVADPSTVPGYENAKHKAKNTLLEAEKFKAKVTQPTGTFYECESRNYENFSNEQELDPDVQELQANVDPSGLVGGKIVMPDNVIPEPIGDG